MALDCIEAPGENTSLSVSELAIGAVEIAWRVLPLRRCLVVPPHSCARLAARISTGDVAREGPEFVRKVIAEAETSYECT